MRTFPWRGPPDSRHDDLDIRSTGAARAFCRRVLCRLCRRNFRSRAEHFRYCGRAWLRRRGLPCPRRGMRSCCRRRVVRGQRPWESSKFRSRQRRGEHRIRPFAAVFHNVRGVSGNSNERNPRISEHRLCFLPKSGLGRLRLSSSVNHRQVYHYRSCKQEYSASDRIL